MPNLPSDGTSAAPAKIATAPHWSTSPVKPVSRGEQELAIQKAYADQLLDKAPEAIVVMDHEMRVLRVNPEFTRTFGYSAEESEGRCLDDLIVPPSRKEEGLKVGQAALSGNTVEIESERCRKDGTVLQTSLLVTPVTVAGGAVGFYAIYRDITQRKHAEKMQAALYRTAALASTTGDLNELYAAIHEIVGELVDARNFYIALYDEVHHAITYPYAVDEVDTSFPPPGVAVPFGTGYTEYLIRTGKPLLATEETYRRLKAAGEIDDVGAKAVSWLGIPLEIANQVIGVLALQSYSEKVRFGEREKEILTFVSHQIANAIAHRRNEEELRANESKFRTLAETASSAIYIHSETMLMYVNRAVERYTGYPRVELIGRDPWSLVHPDFLFLREHVANAAIGQHMRNEFKIIRKDGSERWWDFSGTVILFEGYRALLGTALDITDRKKAEESATLQRALMEQLFESSPEAVLLLSQDHRVMKCNREFTKIFGFTEEEALGKTPGELIVPEHLQEQAAQITREAELGSGMAVEAQRMRKDRSLVDVSIMGTGIDVGGKRVAYFAIYRDISSRKQAERSLHELNLSLERRVRERTEQLEEANRELEAFSYSVSHDLRAPLRHVDGFVRLLTKREAGKLDATSARYFQDIADSSRRMGMLIDDLLAFSRTSRVELHERTVDLDALFERVRQQLSHDAAGRNVSWQIAQVPQVLGDENLLQIAVTNLLSNALKYSAPREQCRISVSVARQDKNEVTILVRDNGVGFDMKYVHKLFGVFQRLHHEDEFEGTGIGLATVRRIISRHGGQVWAESELDKGSSFYFTLKRAPQHGSKKDPVGGRQPQGH